MSDPNRPRASNLRQTSMPYAGNTSGQSPALLARINEKKLELENYRELRDLSAQLAGQMQTLEEKLSTVANGAEAIAAVLSNWQDVLKAINMASMKIPRPREAASEDEANEHASAVSDLQLPQTLIRIPVTQPSKQQSNATNE